MALEIQPQAARTGRAALIRQGLLLVALSISWMVVEGVISVSAGLAANSVALLAFGVDSFIELASDLPAWYETVAVFPQPRPAAPASLAPRRLAEEPAGRQGSFGGSGAPGRRS